MANRWFSREEFSIAFALIRHFGSLTALSRASFLELRQILPFRKAEAVFAALESVENNLLRGDR
jgi:hypothetical protein